MKNDDFLSSQYEELDWFKQEEAKINVNVNKYIIEEIISRKKFNSLSFFDMGFGVGFFIKMFYKKARDFYDNILIEACEPSRKNFQEFKKDKIDMKVNHNLNLFKSSFLDLKIENDKFDVLSSIYVFNCLKFEELDKTLQKISNMLKNEGLFFLVVSSDDCFKKRVEKEKDLLIEKNIVELEGSKYQEIIHYTDLEGIGRVVDCNRETRLYIALAEKYGLSLEKKEEVFDNNLISSVLIFKK